MGKKRAKLIKSPLTKEQVINQFKTNEALKNKLSFIKEKFWPALCAASNNIEDAQQLLSGFNTQVMQEFLADMKDKKMDDLKLAEKLDKTSPKYQENLDMLSLFEGMNVFEAKDYIEGMRSEIGLFLREENESRPLSELKTKWIDQI